VLDGGGGGSLIVGGDDELHSRKAYPKTDGDNIRCWIFDA
jgi:hypothetical protein